ncbi:MAG: recombinase RecA [Euryarchaeota archaeon]|nr:recombinase RecA [Euryarchaeota archaeon]MBU4139717.1 recombinase RecA [Euryarchaeota archaeon]
MDENFSLGIKELDAYIGRIKKGSNILLMGHPMGGKEIILHNIMYHGAAINNNAVISVTTRQSANNIIEWFKESNLILPMSRIGIVDCVTKTLGSDTIENGSIKIASSPGDLTSIGVRISEFSEEFYMKKNIKNHQLHINSLSTILMYSNTQIVFRFLHVFTRRIKETGAIGIYDIDSGMHDEQTIATLKQLCDGLIEVKYENDRNFIRIVGFSALPSPWFEYEIEKERIKIVK